MTTRSKMRTISLDPTAAGRHLTLSEIEDLVDGNALLRVSYVNEKPRSMRLDEKEREQFEAIKKRGYWYRRGGKATKICELAYRWFETSRQPILTIDPAKKYAKIKMDLLPTERAHRDAWDAFWNKILTENDASIGDPPPEIGGFWKHIGCLTVIQQVPVDNADRCAAWLLHKFEEVVGKPAN